MAQLISIVNMKGGVGKSTSTMMLAETLAAQHQKRVLVIDFDPQTNVSLMLAGYERWLEAQENERTIDFYFEWEGSGWRPGTFPDFVLRDVSDVDKARTVDLVAAAPELRYTERDLIAALVTRGFFLDAIEKRIRERLLKVGIQTLRDRYDYILVDCPPGISMAAEASIMASDFVIVPTIPDVVSRMGLAAFTRRALANMQASVVSQQMAQRLLILASKVEEGNSLHEESLETLQQDARDGKWRCLETVIHQTRDIGFAAQRLEAEDGTRAFHRKYGVGAATASALADEILAITRTPERAL